MHQASADVQSAQLRLGMPSFHETPLYYALTLWTGRFYPRATPTQVFSWSTFAGLRFPLYLYVPFCLCLSTRGSLEPEPYGVPPALHGVATNKSTDSGFVFGSSEPLTFQGTLAVSAVTANAGPRVPHGGLERCSSFLDGHAPNLKVWDARLQYENPQLRCSHPAPGCNLCASSKERSSYRTPIMQRYLVSLLFCQATPPGLRSSRVRFSFSEGKD